MFTVLAESMAVALSDTDIFSRESFFAAAAHATSPNERIDVKHAFGDGDFVVTHSLVVRSNPDEPDVAVVHILRFKGEKVVELRDLGRLLRKDSPNENGAF